MSTESRRKLRIRNPIQTRRKLLQAAVDLVAAKGPEALSLKEAAQKANLSRGVAYQHFKDRDHLLREARSWISNRLQDGVTRFNGASLHDRVIYTTKLVLDNPEASKLMIADALAGQRSRPPSSFVQIGEENAQTAHSERKGQSGHRSRDHDLHYARNDRYHHHVGRAAQRRRHERSRRAFHKGVEAYIA